MTPEKKAEYQKLAEEVMAPGLTVAARRLGQAVEEIHSTQIAPLREEAEKLCAELDAYETAARTLLRALKGLLACPEIADTAPEDKDSETHDAERRARAAIAQAEAAGIGEDT